MKNTLLSRGLFRIMAVFMVFGVAYSVSHAASEITLFSDSFEQSGSSLANKWGDFSGANTPSRDDTEDGFTVRTGASGNGLRLEGHSGSNPDDGAEREIATKGYADLILEYSRAIGGFELGDGDSFIAQYALDEGLFVTLETLSVDQAHGTISFFIPNPDRHTKLTLRFFVNGDHDSDKAGVDNVVLKGADAPRFYDGFESNDFGTGGWSTEESPQISTNNSNVWTDNNISSDGHSANLDGASSDNPDDAITVGVSTTGYQNIKMRYARKADNMSSEENLRSYYSTDGGSTWSTLEGVEDVSYASVMFPLPESANNNPDFKIRFELNGNNSSDDSHIDDVVVWGNALPQRGTITVHKDIVAPDGKTDVSDNHEFSVTLNGGNAQNISENNSYTYDNLIPGTYIIAEVTGDPDFDLLSISGDDDNDASNGAPVTVTAGQDTNVTITNAQKRGHLTVIKHVVNHDIGTATASDFTMSIEGTNVSNSEFLGDEDGMTITLDPGEYSVGEYGPEGYAMSQTEDCSGTMTSNGDFTCTITNSDIPTGQGAITVIKKVVNDNGGELGVENFTLLVDDEEVDSGAANFLDPGDYFVSEDVLPEGYLQTSISCTNSESNTTDGIIVLGEQDAWVCIIINDDQPGMLHIVKHLINDDGGTAVASDFRFSVNDGDFAVFEEDGQNDITVNAGIYSVSEDEADGYTTTYDNCEDVAIPNGDEAVCTITNDDQGGEIHGTKFEDMNGNGQRDEDELGLAGWTINLLNNGEIVDTTETDESGRYSFFDVFAGFYTIEEEGQEGWMQTTALGQVIVHDGSIINGTDFGNFHEGITRGAKWEDANKNGQWDEGENSLDGWMIIARNGELTKTATTTDGGRYQFTFGPTELGEWIITEEDRSGWTRTSEAQSYAAVVSSGTDNGGYVFGNWKHPRIEGYKFNDENGDGVWDEGERGIVNWEVRVDRLGSGEEEGEIIPIELVALSLTGSHGGFSIPVPTPGNYRVTETQQSGWAQTAPADSFFDVFVELTDTVVNTDSTDNQRELLFGNKEIPQTTPSTGGGDSNDSSNNTNDNGGGGGGGPIEGLSFGGTFGGGEGQVLGEEITLEEQIAALQKKLEELQEQLIAAMRIQVEYLRNVIVQIIQQMIADLQAKLAALQAQ